jgi:flagellar protein FliS
MDIMFATMEYLETQVATATPYRLHQMVVDAAIRTIRRGLEALEFQRWEAMEAAFSRSRDCLTELLGGLVDDRAPALTEPQKGLFLFVYRSLVEGELRREPERIRDALRILEQHRQTWLELGDRLPRDTAPTVPQPHAREWVG